MGNSLPPDTIQLIEAFAAFGETLNVTHAADKLKISRPTMLRRLRTLEKLCGGAIIDKSDPNRFRMTEFGEAWLGEAMTWLEQGDALRSHGFARLTGLMSAQSGDGKEPFYAQQHALKNVWTHGVALFDAAMTAWTDAKGKADSPLLAEARAVSILSRLNGQAFVIVEIGKKAPMVEWLGEAWCLSSIGKPLSATPMSSAADRFVTHAYRQALKTGSPWYDHVSADLPRAALGRIQRANYRRLILPVEFPDGSPAIMSIVELSDDLVIDGYEVPRVNQSNRED
ncbi:MAG: LysR family transcriptional regulator [Pseudomonadota bacterium]